MRKVIAAVVALAVLGAVSAGITPSFAATKAVKAKGNAWSPKSLTVKAGDKIRFAWRNTGEAHNVRKKSGKGGSMSKHEISDTGSATFSVPSNAKRNAKYGFLCEVHPKMTLTATVR